MTQSRFRNKNPRRPPSNNQGGSGSFFDRFVQFEQQMDQSRINLGSIPQYLLGFQECPDCHELTHTIRYRNEVRYIVAGARKWSWHQCPQPVDPDWSDDAEQYDGDGNPV